MESKAALWTLGLVLAGALGGCGLLAGYDFDGYTLAADGGVPGPCADGVLDGRETDVDCGGSCTTKCADGKKCVDSNDCLHADCLGGVCISCVDGIRNGGESDVDCGGSCAVKCAFGKACTKGGDCAGTFCPSGSCDALVLSTGQLAPAGVAVAPGEVYFTANDAVWQVPIAGGATTSFAPGQSFASDIVVNGTTVIWHVLGGIAEESIGGGTVVSDLTSASVSRIAADGTSIYWADGHGTIQRVTQGGLGGVTTIASGQDTAYAVALDATSVYWTNQGGAAFTGSVMKAPRTGVPDGGTAVQLVTARNSPGAIAVDADHVYWVDIDDKVIMTVPSAGGPATMLASGYSRVFYLAIDATDVYWTTGEVGGVVARVPKSGGPVTVIASGQNNPGGLTVDTNFVYWVTGGDGTVKKIHK